MALYRIRGPLTDKETTYLDGSWPWHLPYLSCDVCGRKTGAEGVSYPEVDLSLLAHAGDFLAESRHNAKPPDIIQDMVALVHSHSARDLWIPPRTSFGHFVGHVEDPTKRLFDFAWAFSNPFVTKAALDGIEQAGIHGLQASTADITYRKRFIPTSPYLELQVDHEVSLADPLQPMFGDEARQFRCKSCGFDNGVLPKVLRVLCDSVPIGTHIMRCREYPICKIVTEDLALTIMRLKLTGVRLERIEVV